MSAPFLIEAMVQPAKGSPWLKVQYITRNNDVAWHMDNILRREYHDVASVKSRPALSETLDEFFDAQGNTRWINNAPVVEGDPNEHVVPNSDPQPGN